MAIIWKCAFCEAELDRMAGTFDKPDLGRIPALEGRYRWIRCPTCGEFNWLQWPGRIASIQEEP